MNVAHGMKTVDVPCPECGLRPSRMAVPSRTGAYCHCERCNYLWHEDLPKAELSHGSSRLQPQRRKTDRAGT